MRFRNLSVAWHTPDSMLAYLLQNRHAFHGAVLDIVAFLRDIRNSIMNPAYSIPSFWCFLEQLADGHHQSQYRNNQSNNSVPARSSSQVWFRDLWIRRTWFSQDFINSFFGLPFVRRHTIIRITSFELVSAYTRGSITDWLFDDTDYYGNSGDNGPSDGHRHRRCFGHRHLALYIDRSLSRGDGDAFPLIIAIKEKVSRASTLNLMGMNLRNRWGWGVGEQLPDECHYEWVLRHSHLRVDLNCNATIIKLFLFIKMKWHFMVMASSYLYLLVR